MRVRSLLYLMCDLIDKRIPLPSPVVDGDIAYWKAGG